MEEEFQEKKLRRSFQYKGHSVYCFYQLLGRNYAAIAKIKQNGKWMVFNIEGNSLDEVERRIKEKINHR